MGAEPMTPDQEAYYARRYSGKSTGHSGWGNGTPQCYACRRILRGYNQQCPSCGGYSRPRDGARGGLR